ncbi:uncharacterized protein EI97DRAFT_436561 [Westerdykella ornata]|uniref:Uncharacterized protein n=1 Tax=Westerdykella ornata TaxID=318751 RepID=A0A6A6J8R1_WESOR|nr:uncharacterized protein EI97DRAFT_436561 [Westerdykella ornata]KAF2272951.1 hypothetical protein EI97DRAFT_436561 [Westerdykella ornata]
MPPRRFQFLLAVLFLLTTTLFLFGPPTSADLPSYDQVADAVKHPKMPSLENLPSLEDLPSPPRPFGPPVHKPPVQPDSNSTSSYGLIQWFRNYKWHIPFSSAVTFDENTAVLPPLNERPPIYTYYEARDKQSKEVTEAENRLVLAWRRAWWAQGFKPHVLSRDEAKQHPLYQMVQRLKLEKVDPEVEVEIMRWLAWGHMQGGILANWLALPMAEYDNPMLGLLRRKQYPQLSRIDGLENGIFFGEAGAVDAAIKKAIENPLFTNVTQNHDKIVDLKKGAGAMANLLGKDIKAESKSNGIAYYSAATLANVYKSVADKFTNTTQLEGLDLLANLINSHLHLTFQNIFSEGIAVIKPLPEHTTALMYEVIDIARNLTQCPTSPVPKSCPPNRSKCTPCNPAKPMKLELHIALKDTTKQYQIGTVPHPYTLGLLHYTRDTLDANFLHSTGRDQWLAALMADILKEHSSSDQVVRFKEVVASPQSAPTSLWLTAERISQADLDWIFGFNLPQIASPNKDPSSPSEDSELVIFPRPDEPAPIEGVQEQDAEFIKHEEERLQKARDAIKSTDKHWKEVINMVEQWNQADAEAWRFARAFSARRRQERKKWEEEEKKFTGSEQKSGVHTGGGGGRWIDKF